MLVPASVCVYARTERCFAYVREGGGIVRVFGNKDTLGPLGALRVLNLVYMC